MNSTARALVAALVLVGVAACSSKDLAGAHARTANFDGGWGVAYDLDNGPGAGRDGTFCADCGRGAFGVAGTGSPIDPQATKGWPYNVAWSDGSEAGYGLEGREMGTVAQRQLRFLAFLHVAGQRCLYNVWSYIGREHLEHLVGDLRFVATS